MSPENVLLVRPPSVLSKGRIGSALRAGVRSLPVSNIHNELSVMQSYGEHVSNRWIRVYLCLAYALCQLTFFATHPAAIVRTIRAMVKHQPEAQSDLLILAALKRFRFRLLSW